MAILSNTFESKELSLKQYLADLHTGDMQLPNFQRNWVWKDPQICSLIATVSLSFPIGSVLLLGAGKHSSDFGTRRIATAPGADTVEPNALILDGQQRLTSLYRVLRAEQLETNIDLRGSDKHYVYFLDIQQCFNGARDREKAVVSEPLTYKNCDLKRTFNLDNPVMIREYENGWFPLHFLFNDDLRIRWKQGYIEFHQDENGLKQQQTDEFFANVIAPILDYKIPTTIVSGDADKEAICRIFETLNNTGVKLTVFDLLTARYAADGYNLRNDWKEQFRHMKKYSTCNRIRDIDFILATTLASSYRKFDESIENDKRSNVRAKREDVLSLTKESYESTKNDVRQGFILAHEFLDGEGICTWQDIPYSTLLIPLATILSNLKSIEDDEEQAKLSQWFWCSVFGERYGRGTDTRSAEDVQTVIPWIRKCQPAPMAVQEATVSGINIVTQARKTNALYKGMMALIRKAGCVSLREGALVVDIQRRGRSRKLDHHHIFPQDYGRAAGINRRYLNAIVNLTPIPVAENKAIGGAAPATHLPRTEEMYNIDSNCLAKRLETHGIDMELIRENKFGEFFNDRALYLLDLVKKATGRKLIDEDSDELRSFINMDDPV